VPTTEAEGRFLSWLASEVVPYVRLRNRITRIKDISVRLVV